MGDIECEHCGGTEFYKEAGFFFCKGCQVQSQEVQEYEFDEFVAENQTKTKKVQKVKSDKVDNKITSWECYNYVLLGLTNELINLGADKKLKSVVRILWLRYLEKLQVIQRNGNELPKLQAVNSGLDAEIVYGKLKKKRKRRKSSSSETNPTSLESSSVKYERIRKKRALIKAQYDDFTQKSLGTSSLHNETLTSLQTESGKASKKKKRVAYNIYASKELARIKKSKYHRDQHRVDFENNLKCHKTGYRNISSKYRLSLAILSINKIYSILYLGLLILGDKIQLSDILRFIKEGHLSYNCYNHFFPEHFSDKIFNFRNFIKCSVFSIEALHRVTFKMSVFLKVDFFIPNPDLIELSERYCKEMNLPNKVCKFVQKLIAISKVTMAFQQAETKVPNYEARVLSIIVFVLKLLFGLDDETEFHLGRYSEILNQSEAVNPKMFDIMRWLKYIEYRDFVMSQHHFSTSYNNSRDAENVDLALGTLAKKEFPSEVKFNVNKDNYKQLLEKLKRELDEPPITEFPPTLTPFRDYVKLLPKTNFLDIFYEDFTEHSLIHIMKPNPFLYIINKNGLEIVNGGANLNWILEKNTCSKVESRLEARENRKFVTVKLTLDDKTIEAPQPQQKETENRTEAERLRRDFQAANEAIFRRNQIRFESLMYNKVTGYDLEKIKRDLKKKPQVYEKHYNPFERFWMRFKTRVEELNHDEFMKFFETFPYNFRLIFKECQRIAQLDEQLFFIEYQLTELYLVYRTLYRKNPEKQQKIKDKMIASYLDRCRHLW